MSKRRQLFKQGLTMPMLDRVLRGSDDLKNLEVRPVQTLEELTGAARLVYAEYLRCGYIAPNKNHWKISLYQVLPSTVTFVAILRKKHILGTITLVEDSPLGLPSDHIYKQDFDSLRLDRRQLGEFTMFALNRTLLESEKARVPMSTRLLLMMKLIEAGYIYFRSATAINEIVAVFHPKHDFFYEFMQMERLGEMKNHASVKGNPALARHHDILVKQQTMVDHICYKYLFGATVPHHHYNARLKYSETDIQKLFVDHSNILASASSSQLKYIKNCYPTYQLDSLLQTKNIVAYVEEALEMRRQSLEDPQNQAV